MSGLSGRQPYRFCVRTARPGGCVGHEVLPSEVCLVRRRRRCPGRGRRPQAEVPAGRRRLLAPGRIEVSVSCAQRSLNPARKAEDEQREPPVVRGLIGGDREVEQPAVEGERDRHRERAADQRAQAAEEERVRAADVVVELERAAVDPLDHAHDRADGAGDQGRDRSRPRRSTARWRRRRRARRRPPPCPPK